MNYIGSGFVPLIIYSGFSQNIPPPPGESDVIDYHGLFIVTYNFDQVVAVG